MKPFPTQAKREHLRRVIFRTAMAAFALEGAGLFVLAVFIWQAWPK